MIGASSHGFRREKELLPLAAGRERQKFKNSVYEREGVLLLVLARLEG
jgi:hypothetical protein